jgi:hypothetical protein
MTGATGAAACLTAAATGAVAGFTTAATGAVACLTTAATGAVALTTGVTGALNPLFFRSISIYFSKNMCNDSDRCHRLESWSELPIKIRLLWRCRR